MPLIMHQRATASSSKIFNLSPIRHTHTVKTWFIYQSSKKRGKFQPSSTMRSIVCVCCLFSFWCVFFLLVMCGIFSTLWNDTIWKCGVCMCDTIVDWWTYACICGKCYMLKSTRHKTNQTKKQKKSNTHNTYSLWTQSVFGFSVSHAVAKLISNFVYIYTSS